MSEWKCYKLNDISSLSNGINFDKSAYTSGVKLIGVSDFKNRIHPDYDSLQEVDSKVVKSGDYLEKETLYLSVLMAIKSWLVGV